jgi:exodeoxyribonuclease III
VQIISWNINGIRAGIKKGLWSWVNAQKPDILCFQETKAQAEQVPPSLDEPKDYYTYWNSADRPGYSGTATFTKPKPTQITNGFGLKKFDQEGRVLTTKFPRFTLLNVYFPNGKRDQIRLDYKLEFYDQFLNHIELLRKKGEKIIFCGDVNTAHREIDLARPKDNEKISGFLPSERAWIDQVTKKGYIDTFRHFYPKKTDQYSWWSQRSGARQRNVGWRIDYFFISPSLLPHLKKAFILPDVPGSDHCPIGIDLKF